MSSVEKAPGRVEKPNAEKTPSMRKTLDGVQTAVDNRFTAAETSIHTAQRALRGTEHAGDVDGALVDLQAAKRHIHTELLTAVGQAAERKNPGEAHRLVQRGRDLLATQEKFADAV